MNLRTSRKEMLRLSVTMSRNVAKKKDGAFRKKINFVLRLPKKRSAKPRIKIIENGERSSLLVNLIKFYDEYSDASLESESSLLPFANSMDSDWINPKKTLRLTVLFMGVKMLAVQISAICLVKTKIRSLE